jgi:hypothetical protein
MSLTDVPVSIDSRVVDSPGIVEVNRTNILESHGSLHFLNQRCESIFFANVVTCCERMRRIETDTER